MFDSAPPNLPVEPAAPTGAPPSPLPPARPPSPNPLPGAKPRKEPEDIFADVEQPGAAPAPTMPMMEEGPKRGFPWKIVIAAVVGLALLGGIAFGAWLLLFRTGGPTTRQAAEEPQAPTAPQPEQVEQPPIVEPRPPVTQPPAGVNIPAPESITPPPPPPPPVVVTPTEGKDSDGDLLTDAEESFYGTDPLSTDTDGDTYTDGSEVQNLFSPVSRGKSLDAEAFIQRLAVGNWSFLVPKPWSLIVDTTFAGAAASISTGSATRFSVRVSPTSDDQSFGEVVAALEPGATLKSFRNKAGLEAMQTSDGLRTYVSSGDSVLILTYDLNGDTTYEYRDSYAMVVNSVLFTAAP